MALPVVRTALECADFKSTVLPYVGQLYALPQVIFESISNPAALKQIYLDTNPLISAFAFSLFLSPVFLLVSEVNKNYSQVDRVWSILPTVYNAHYALYAHMMGIEAKRLDTVLAASAVWSARLTYNYLRKGGYNIGSEDYRWAILRKYISPPLFFLFNVTFISLAQSVLLFLITTPSYLILLTSRLSSASSGTTDIPSWGTSDLVASRAMIFMVVIAAAADQQQWNFQNAKASYQKTAKVPAQFERDDLDRGFITSGLWAYSRHPNFAAEQTFWLCLYQWSCLITGTLYNWTALGAVSYLILFQASTWFTELVSADKYEEYKTYQKQVGMFVPKGTTPFVFPKSVAKADEDGKTTKGNGAVNKQVDADGDKARERYNLRH